MEAICMIKGFNYSLQKNNSKRKCYEKVPCDQDLHKGSPVEMVTKQQKIKYELRQKGSKQNHSQNRRI